jgi:hypothetical protein
MDWIIIQRKTNLVKDKADQKSRRVVNTSLPEGAKKKRELVFMRYGRRAFET